MLDLAALFPLALQSIALAGSALASHLAVSGQHHFLIGGAEDVEDE